jgi:putative transposase
MPTGLVRLHNTGNLHFLTFSCHGRRPYLRAPETRDLVENAIERARIRYGFWITGYVVMLNHVHLLISEPERMTIADVMKAIKLSVSLRQNQRPFWEQRYYDFNVFTEEKRIEKLRYMHRNPVARALAQRPEDWLWSSFDHYATGSVRGVEVESPWTALRRQRTAEARVRESGPGAPTRHHKLR